MAVQKPTSPIKSSTQSFTEIEDIKDDILLLKDFSASIVIGVGAVNFWLLSAEEQSSIIYAYSSLLNSLSFPIQIVILSKKMDISSYLEYLESVKNTSKDDLMKTRLTKTSLYPKRDHLLRLLAKIGLRATVLQKQELTELFYNLYNPSATGRMLAPIDSYTDVVMSNN